MSAEEAVEEVVGEIVEIPVKSHILLLALVGAGVGAGAAYGGYKYGVRTTTTKYEAILEQEIEAAKAFYARLHKKEDFETPEGTVAHLHPVRGGMAVDEAASALLKYQGHAVVEDEEDDTDVEVEASMEGTVNVFMQSQPDDNFDLEAEMELRDPAVPYVVHVEEFMQNEPEHDQITITYYAGDGTLADEQEKEIPSVDPIVGETNLERFGHGSRDARVVYIRNERIGTDFEVLLSDGKYAHEVLGFEHADGGSRGRRQRNQPRKFRGEDE